MIGIAPITTKEEFKTMKDDWNELLNISCANTVFLTWEWLFNWWEAFGEEGKLHILSVRRDDDRKPIGILPFYIREEKLLGLINIKIADFMGTGIVCSDYLDIIVRPGFEETVILKLFEYFKKQKSIIDFIQFSDINESSRTILVVKEQHKKMGLSLIPLGETTCPFLPLTENWDDCMKYVTERSKKNFAYYQRRIKREFAMEYEQWDSNRDPKQGTDILRILHQDRWESRGEPGLFRHKKFSIFHRKIIEEFAHNGWLRLFFLKLDGKYVASIYAFNYNSKYYYYQAGFDDSYKKYSVGQCSLYMAIQKAFEEKVAEFDFLRGAMPYKYEWTSLERHNVTFLVGKGNYIERLYLSYCDLERALKTKAKEMLPEQISDYIRRRMRHKKIDEY